MARRILEAVMIDHTPVNIWIRSPCRKYILGKPILTALIDEYSGMVIGFFIGFKEPSAYTVCMAIRHSIMDKLYIQDRYPDIVHRSEEHTSELQSLMRISYAVFCLKKKKKNI